MNAGYNYQVAYPSTANDKFGNHQVSVETIKGTSNHACVDTSMLCYEETDPNVIPLTEMFMMEQRYDKEWYRSRYPMFDEEALNVMEWSSAGQLHELNLRYKVKRREEKLRKRRELHKKMKAIGRRVNTKKMKKIKRKVRLDF